MTVRNWYLCRLQVYVSVNFASLALQARPGHLGNGLGHLWPAEPGGDEVAGSSHSRVVYRVQRLENRFPVLDRYQRAEHPCRNVPEHSSVSVCLGCDLQRGGVWQVPWVEAIAEKLTGCASAMAARIGQSGAASPSSGQSSAVEAGDGRWLGGGGCAAAEGGRLRAFSCPGVCRMSEVNSTMKESCRCWRADQGGVVRNRDVTSGLWSVSRRNCRPSSKNLKCLTALKAASSSLSKVEYLVPAPDSFLE